MVCRSRREQECVQVELLTSGVLLCKTLRLANSRSALLINVVVNSTIAVRMLKLLSSKAMTSMLVTDVGDGCSRQNVLVTSLRCW